MRRGPRRAGRGSRLRGRIRGPSACPGARKLSSARGARCPWERNRAERGGPGRGPSRGFRARLPVREVFPGTPASARQRDRRTLRFSARGGAPSAKSQTGNAGQCEKHLGGKSPGGEKSLGQICAHRLASRGRRKTTGFRGGRRGDRCWGRGSRRREKKGAGGCYM